MENLTCCNCGIIFGVPEHWVSTRREDRRDFWCPNGHIQAFVKSTADRLREAKERSALAFQAQLNEARHALLVAEKERDTERRKRRRIEARISKGVCPCCNRTFGNLQQHMATKHKDYALPPGQKKQIEAPKEVVN